MEPFHSTSNDPFPRHLLSSSTMNDVLSGTSLAKRCRLQSMSLAVQLWVVSQEAKTAAQGGVENPSNQAMMILHSGFIRLNKDQRQETEPSMFFWY